MIRAAIGDVHLSGFESDPLDSDGLPFRLGLINKSLDNIIQECRKRNIKHVDFLGDLINDKSIIYTIAQEVFIEFLLKNSDIEFTIISGNHDLSSTGKLQKSAISVFKTFPNVKCIINKPEVIDNITYVPYFSNFLEILSSIEHNDILISHLGLNEAHLQSGLSRIDKIRLKDLSSKFKLAILGHYHKPQFLENSTIKVHYAGNIIHKDWNDKNEKKQFLVYDTKTLEVEEIQFDCGREFREYIITEDTPIDDISKEIEMAQNQGHVVRVINKCSKKVSDEMPINTLVIEKKEYDITNRGIEITQTKDEQLKKYLEIKEIPENERQEYLDILSKYDILITGLSDMEDE